MRPSPRPAARFPEIAATPDPARALGRRRVLLGGIGVLAGAWARAPRADADAALVIDPEVRTATARGRARVLVELRLAGGTPASGSAPPSERAIAALQQVVLARLPQASYRLVHRYTSVPLLSLEIDADALRALEAMGDVVMGVRADRLRVPGRSP